MSRKEEDFDFLDDLMEQTLEKKKTQLPIETRKEEVKVDPIDMMIEDEDEFLSMNKKHGVPQRTIPKGLPNLNGNKKEDKSNKGEDLKEFPSADRGDRGSSKDSPSTLTREPSENFLELVEIEDVDDEADFSSIYEDDEINNHDVNGLSPTMRKALEWEPPEPKSDEDNLVNEWIQTGWVGYLHLDQILTEAIISGASDVHITADRKTSMTRNGDIIRYNNYVIPDDETLHSLVHDGILNHQQQQVFNTNFEYEGAYELMYGPFIGRRTRLTIGKTEGKYFLVFRIINEQIPKVEDLGIEEELVSWSHYANGLFLLCGPTGSGKSTTLASIVHNLQMTTQKKIISIEKPIEYLYPDNSPSLVVQREVGEDTRGFYEGLTSAMRQSPNVILLGEVRNTEEVTELLRAAETGHLAISTMHTNSVATTVNRIQNLFDGNEQRRIMSTLADTMRGIGNQVLVKTIDGNGRFAVRELLTINDEIKGLIIAGDIQGIRKYQIRNNATMEHKLTAAVKAGKCKYEDAIGQAADPHLFEKLMNE